MRSFLINKICKLSKINKKVVLIVNDVGYGYVDQFRKKFPDRFFNGGVSEQNIMGLAAGLASKGFKVFVYGIGNFVTLRCYEQIRNDVDYHNLDVNIIAVGSGLSYGSAGYSHHLIQDYSAIRSLKNILIHSPCDLNELNFSLDQIFNSSNPSYLRIGSKKKNQAILRVKKINYHILKKKNKKLIIFTSDIKDFVIKIILKKEKMSDIISIPIWGGKTKFLIKILKKYNKIVVVEDHVLSGGFYSWIVENLNVNFFKNREIISYSLSKNVIGKSGTREYLMKKYIKKK